MQTGEVIFGGVGAGLYGMLLYAILAVFIAGLMVGRTPEYLGKKIEQKEVKMAMLRRPRDGVPASWSSPASARSIAVREGRLLESAGPGDREPEQRRPARLERDPLRLHQRSRKQRQRVRRHHRQHALVRPDDRPRHADRPVPVHHSRCWPRRAAWPRKKKVPASAGTFPTHGPLFVGLLVGTVIIVGALTFFPALSLGPIVEHFLMHRASSSRRCRVVPGLELSHGHHDAVPPPPPRRSAPVDDRRR